MSAGTAVNFSDLELMIIDLMCKDLNMQEISSAIHLPVNTIQRIVAMMMDKIDTSSEVGLVLYALKHGLYSLV